MGTKDHGLSIEEADHLLAGHIPAGRDDLAALATDLASLSVAYRHEVDPVDVGRWAAQAAAQARLIPSDKGDLAATSASNAHRPAPQASGLPKRRIPVLNSIAAFVATTVGKTVVAGALVAATTTGGLAATGNLPGQSVAPDPAITVVDPTGPGSAGSVDAPDTAGSVDSVDAPDTADTADSADSVDAPDACDANDPASDSTDPASDSTDPLATDAVDSSTDGCDVAEPVEADEPAEPVEPAEADEPDTADAPDSADAPDTADAPDSADAPDTTPSADAPDAPDSADEG